MIDVERAREILCRYLLSQSTDETMIAEALRYLGGPIDLEHEVKYCNRILTAEESAKYFLNTLRRFQSGSGNR